MADTLDNIKKMMKCDFPSARARVKMAAKTPLLGMVPALVNANVTDTIIQLLDHLVASVRTSKCTNSFDNIR